MLLYIMSSTFILYYSVNGLPMQEFYEDLDEALKNFDLHVNFLKSNNGHYYDYVKLYKLENYGNYEKRPVLDVEISRSKPNMDRLPNRDQQQGTLFEL